jgi:ribosomal protein S18 acetylase RimI-like enzyme
MMPEKSLPASAMEALPRRSGPSPPAMARAMCESRGARYDPSTEFVLSLEIHDVELAQIRGLADVQVRSWKAAYRGIIPDAHLDGLSIDESERRWKTNTTRPSTTTTVVAEILGTVVGFASFGPCRDADRKPAVGELYAIYVDPHRFGQYIGGSLMAYALNRFRFGGYEGAVLWVLDRNAHARHFYEQWEWSIEGGKKTIHFGDVAVEEVRYEHALARMIYL